MKENGAGVRGRSKRYKVHERGLRGTNLAQFELGVKHLDFGMEERRFRTRLPCSVTVSSFSNNEDRVFLASPSHLRGA